ncbi:hypothetical protein [Roseibium sp.]|uniref:hypothetical protein n=1 Tax=Roseibium sp. TaxID=1936156 RepID=UPI0032676586
MRANEVVRQGLVVSMMVLLTGLVAACQSSSGTQVSQQPSYLSQIHLAQVDVDFSNAERPLLVGELDAEISGSVSGGSAVETLGTRVGVVNGRAKQAALEKAIAANVRPYVEEALTPLFTGTRPVRAVVTVKSVFIRSRMSLYQLTGTKLTVNGKKRPDNAQFIAGLKLYDQSTGLPFQEVEPITRIDDGSITLAGGGPKAPRYGKSARLDQLIFDYARAAANALQRNASGSNFSIAAEEGDKKTLWESRGSF